MVEGVANFEGCNIHDNTADAVCLHRKLSLNFHPAPRWNVTFAHDWQAGGGLYITGTATLTNTNVYDNGAVYVRSLLEPSVTFHPSPRWNVTFAHGWQDYGGGLYIAGTATLTNSNVYSNEANYVRWPSAIA